MVKLIGINVKKSDGFRLVENNGDILVSTTSKFENEAPSLGKGGIVVVPIFQNIDEIDDQDALVFIQKSNYHYFEFKTFDFKHSYIELTEPHKDTHKDIGTSYSTHFMNCFKIDNCEHPYFFDAPYRELLSNWTYIKYQIKFETWILLGHKGKQIPLGSFKWELDVEVEKTNTKWNIVNEKHSSRKEIKNSLEIKSENDDPITVHKLPHLRSVMNEFLERKGQIK